MSPLGKRQWWVAALLGASSALMAGVADSPTPLIPASLHAAFMRTSFSGVNETDAQAAFRVFAVRMGEKRGYAITPHVHIFDGVEELRTFLARGILDMVIIDTWDYLELEPIANLPVTFAAVEQGITEDEYLVVTRNESSIRRLDDLNGKHVVVLRSSNANTVAHWFRTEILALGRGQPEHFLGRLEIKPHLSQTVLPVFFGKADACVVDRRGFEAMVELNPQLGTALHAILISAPYLDTVILVRRDGWDRAEMRGDLIDAIEDMPNDPAGRQIMTLFKFDGVRPFEARSLATMRALRSRYLQLVEEEKAEPTPRAVGQSPPRPAGASGGKP